MVLIPRGTRDKGCKLRVCKASLRGPGDPNAPTARALVSSTSPAKDSLGNSTPFPASLLVQNCLLFFSDVQVKQEMIFGLSFLALNASEVHVCPHMHVRETRCISQER